MRMSLRLTRSLSPLLLTALALAGCAASSPPPPPPPPPVDPGEAPPGWDDGIRPPEAEDLNPDPAIVEVALDARVAALEIVPGTTTPAWTYNGRLCGPLIRAKVGDTVIVHLTNDLPEETTI